MKNQSAFAIFYRFKNSLVACFFIMLLAVGSLSQSANAQFPGSPAFPGGGFRIPAVVEAMPVQDDEKKEDTKKDDKEKADDTPSKRKESKPVNPREVRFHMWDGNIISGELNGPGLTISTEFGDLKIPVEKLYGFRPGLESNQELLNKMTGLIAKLGDKDFNEREKAHKELVAMGPQFLMEVYRFEDGGNAERKRHLKEIREELEAMAEDMDDEDMESDSNPTLIRSDAVSTKDFTIVGKIVEQQFTVKSRYGDLKVTLADVKFMDREMTGGGDVRKSVKIPGTVMLGKNMKSTGIRVEKGDLINFSASGQITMTPWGSNRNTGPEGSSSYSKKDSFNGGSLVMQIGDTKAVYVGKKKSIRAKKSGMLKLGVAIPNDYMSYNYPGEYKVKIQVTGN